jgi:SAM-dependent methyltransferase
LRPLWSGDSCQAFVMAAFQGYDVLMTGRLIRATDGDKVYYVDNGKRHSVLRTDRLHWHGFSPNDVAVVSQEELRRYPLAGPVPLAWPGCAWDDPPRKRTVVIREIATSKLSGSGIEFGAGTSPVSVPLDCEVRFADFISESELRAKSYPAQGDDFAPLSYVMGMEDMSQIADQSVDFIIAAHVIEHLRNPLQALQQARRKLRSGGYLVLIVPDQARSFDRERELTPLDHLVSDYQNPSAERDTAHYYDFFSKAIGFANPDLPIEPRVRDAIATNWDIHFHTWTYRSFGEMIGYSRSVISPWQSVWSQPSIEGEEGFEEFYFVLQA